jgi:ABC-type multidrug transport system permease subunit
MAAFSALTHRNILNTIRNPMLFQAKIFQSIFMALFVGGLFFDIGTRDYTNKEYWNSITGFLFFMTIYSLFMTLSPISLTFPLERDVFFKEQDSKMYNVGQYFLARNIVELPEMALIPLLFVCICYFMVDMGNTAEQFFIHCLVFFLICFCGASLGLLLGSAILDAKSVSAVVPIITLPIILFSGFFKNRDDLPKWIGWIEYISPNKYGFIGFLNNEVAYKNSNISQLDFDVTKWEAIIILFCLGVFFRMLSFFFLWLLRKKSQ